MDRLLPFEFNIENIPGAKIGLVDYFSHQPIQKATITNKYEEEIAVAIITRIRDAIAAIYTNTTSQNCQSQHFNSANHPQFTRASLAHQTNHSKLLSALILRTNQLLLSHSANAAQIQHLYNLDMSTSNASSKTPPTPATSRVTFQSSTPNSTVISTRSSNEGPASPNLELSKE